MQLGATFSHRHLRSLGHNPLKALAAYSRLSLPWIRLGCYWNEVEPTPGTFDFRELDQLIAHCETHDLSVILTVGMKAPRFPEFYLPKWLTHTIPFHHHAVITPDTHQLLYATHMYLYETIKHFRKSRAIRIYQVENEPMDPSGHNSVSISPQFLREEVKLVKTLDPTRKILVTVWGNEAKRRRIYTDAIDVADIVGLDMYFRQPVSFAFGLLNGYIGPIDSYEDTRSVVSEIRKSKKQFWISELQAEPWESGTLVPTQSFPASFLPDHFATNGQISARLRPSVTLLWGFEWWYHQKLMGNPAYWNKAVAYINAV